MNRTNLSASIIICATLGMPLAANAGIIGTAENGSGNCYPFGCPSTDYGGEYQQVYASSAFSGVTDISSITFYNTQQNSGSYALDSGTFSIYLSTTTAPVNGLSTNLASNIGSNETLVYSGALPADTKSGFGGQFNFLLSHDFNYNPAQGNLLMTVASTNGNGSNIYLDFDESGSVTSRAYAGAFPFADPDGLVTGFDDVTPVPLPASAWLLLSALGALAFLTRQTPLGARLTG
jgi:hypothetical protein